MHSVQCVLFDCERESERDASLEEQLLLSLSLSLSPTLSLLFSYLIQCLALLGADFGQWTRHNVYLFI